MIFNITAALLIAKENFKIKAKSLEVYLSVYRRFAQFVETIESEEEETGFLEALAKHRSNYLYTVPQKSQSYHKSALNYWKRVEISRDNNHLPFYQNFDQPLGLENEHTKAYNDTFTDAARLSDAHVSPPSRFRVSENTSDNFDKQRARTIEIEYRMQHMKNCNRQFYAKKDSLTLLLNEFWLPLAYTASTDNIFSNELGWSQATTDIVFEKLRSFVGFLTLPKSDDPATCGMGLEIDEVRILDLINVDYIREYIKFYTARLEKLTRTPLMYLRLVNYVTRPKDGWLRRNPEKIYYALSGVAKESARPSKKTLFYIEEIEDRQLNNESLVTIDGKTTMSTKSRVEIEMNAKVLTICDQVYEEVTEMCNNLKNKLLGTISRDPFEPIWGLVQMDEPMELVVTALRNESHVILNIMSGVPSLKDIKRIQRHMIAFFLTFCPLRSSHWSNMTYIDGLTGHFREVLDGYEIRIPTSEFKNGRSIEINHKKNLTTYHVKSHSLSSFKQIINLYLEKYLPLLKKLNTDNLLFPNMRGGRIDPGSEIRKWVERSLLNVCASRGIEDVYGFGCHAFRHLGAMSILKQTGSMQKAADYLLDDLITLQKYYIKYLTNDYLDKLIEDHVNHLYK